jgi:hypothetical protein
MVPDPQTSLEALKQSVKAPACMSRSKTEQNFIVLPSRHVRSKMLFTPGSGGFGDGDNEGSAEYI